MAIKVDGTVAADSYVEYGVLWDDGTVTEMEMVEAYRIVNSGGVIGAKVVARRVIEMAWAEVTK